MKGSKLRTVRLRLGMTQVELAGKLGVTGNTVARRERDEVSISPVAVKLVGMLSNEASYKP